MNSPLSARALQLVAQAKHQHSPSGKHGMCQYDDGLIWWSGDENCQSFGYEGTWSESEKALWEAAGVLLEGRSWERLKDLGVRELEVFLRDRNSVPALPSEHVEGFSGAWEKARLAVENWRRSGVSLKTYSFPSELVFASLSLADKIRELKAFFLSAQLAPFYQRGGRIELLDVEESTVFIALDSADVPQEPLLDWLQSLAVQVFREPSLNLIPEAFPSGTSKKTI